MWIKWVMWIKRNVKIILGFLVILLLIPFSAYLYVSLTKTTKPAVKPKTHSVVTFNAKVEQKINQADILEGKGIPNAKISILISPGGEQKEVIVDKNGGWSYQISNTLKPKKYRLTITLYDRIGTFVSIKSYPIIITAPQSSVDKNSSPIVLGVENAYAQGCGSRDDPANQICKEVSSFAPGEHCYTDYYRDESTQCQWLVDPAGRSLGCGPTIDTRCEPLPEPQPRELEPVDDQAWASRMHKLGIYPAKDVATGENIFLNREEYTSEVCSNQRCTSNPDFDAVINGIAKDNIRYLEKLGATLRNNCYIAFEALAEYFPEAWEFFDKHEYPSLSYLYDSLPSCSEDSIRTEISEEDLVNAILETANNYVFDKENPFGELLTAVKSAPANVYFPFSIFPKLFALTDGYTVNTELVADTAVAISIIAPPGRIAAGSGRVGKTAISSITKLDIVHISSEMQGVRDAIKSGVRIPQEAIENAVARHLRDLPGCPFPLADKTVYENKADIGIAIVGKVYAQASRRVGCVASIGGRKAMEDAHTIVHGFNNNPNQLLLGVFDGHGGANASKIASEEIAEVVARFINEQIISAQSRIDVGRAFVKAYTFLNRRIKSAAEDGTTALTALIDGNKLTIAWAGDSEAVLSSRGEARQLTPPHDVTNAAERTRVAMQGIEVNAETERFINKDGRELAVSRSLGDKRFSFVDAVPELKDVTLTKQDEFLIMASDGVWHAKGMTYQKAVDMVADALRRGLSEKQAAQLLVDASGSSGDNITAIVVRLSPARESSGLRGGSRAAPGGEFDGRSTDRSGSAPSDTGGVPSDGSNINLRSILIPFGAAGGTGAIFTGAFFASHGLRNTSATGTIHEPVSSPDDSITITPVPDTYDIQILNISKNKDIDQASRLNIETIFTKNGTQNGLPNVSQTWVLQQVGESPHQSTTGMKPIEGSANCSRFCTLNLSYTLPGTYALTVYVTPKNTTNVLASNFTEITIKPPATAIPPGSQSPTTQPTQTSSSCHPPYERCGGDPGYEQYDRTNTILITPICDSNGEAIDFNKKNKGNIGDCPRQ